MNKKKKVIMLCAYARAGKDTVANHLVAKHGYTKMSFAEPIYEMVATMYAHVGMNREQLEWMKANDEKLPDANFTVRNMLQTLGTEWARTYVSPHIWPAILTQKIQVSTATKFVISDCRFMNEYTRLTQDAMLDTKVWTVLRDAAEPQLQHASEQEIETIAAHAQVKLENNGLLGSLYHKIDIEVSTPDVI